MIEMTVLFVAIVMAALYVFFSRSAEDKRQAWRQHSRLAMREPVKLT